MRQNRSQNPSLSKRSTSATRPKLSAFSTTTVSFE